MYHLSEAYLMASYIALLAVYLGALIFGTAAVAPIAGHPLLFWEAYLLNWEYTRFISFFTR